LDTVSYPHDCLEIREDVVKKTLRYSKGLSFETVSISFAFRELEDAGVIEAPEGGFTTEQMGQFVDTNIAKFT
jgi:hypothetical protein